MADYIGCTVKRLAPDLHQEAARTAVGLNPANEVRDPLGLLGVQRIALLTSKYWGPKGVRLTVQFLDLGGNARELELKRKILLHMNAWGTRANVQFVETARDGQVRIARTRGQGHWSYLGTDVLHVGAGQPTMNLDSFTLNTPESEFFRVVRHETGHTLGFPHEHMRRAIVDRIDPTKAILYFGRTQGWSADEVRQQVLTPLEESSLRAIRADSVSIMCYALPGEIMVDGQPVPGGRDIDDLDFSLAADVYPLAVAPPPPPPSPPPVSPPTPAAGNVVLDLDRRLATLPPGWSVK